MKWENVSELPVRSLRIVREMTKAARRFLAVTDFMVCHSSIEEVRWTL